MTRVGLFANRRQRGLVSSSKSCVLHGHEHVPDVCFARVPRVPEQGRFLALPNASVTVRLVYFLLGRHFPTGVKNIAQLGTRRVENFE